MRTQFEYYSLIWYVIGTFKHKPYPCYKKFTIRASQHTSTASKWDGPISKLRKYINNGTYYNHTYTRLWWNKAEEGTGRKTGLVFCQATFPAKSKVRESGQEDGLQAARRNGSWGARKAECCKFKIWTNRLISNQKQASRSENFNWNRAAPLNRCCPALHLQLHICRFCAAVQCKGWTW